MSDNSDNNSEITNKCQLIRDNYSGITNKCQLIRDNNSDEFPQMSVNTCTSQNNDIYL